MTNSDPFEGLDPEKLAEAALGLLALTIHDQCRAWKSIDWDVMDLLYQKGWIADPRGKAKSVALTEEGLGAASRMPHADQTFRKEVATTPLNCSPTSHFF